MKIPKVFQRKGMSTDEKKHLLAWIKSKRNMMQKEPTFDTEESAVKAAVAMLKKDKLSLPSVWKEPSDIGTKYAVVHTDNREKAYISGYTEVVGEQEIFDKANGIKRDHIDEIEEV